MTAQIPDLLRYEGVDYNLFSTPLEDLWDMEGRPLFVGEHTGIWRGYRAEWLIETDRLYLTSISGTALGDSEGRVLRSEHQLVDVPIDRISSPSPRVDVTLGTLFPGESPPIFARWFTGQLRVPQGDQVHYEHLGFQSVHEWEWIITIHQGMVVGSDRIPTGENWRRDRDKRARQQEELAHQRAIPRAARPNPDNWLTCPHCGIAFPLSSSRSWDGVCHISCGGRIELIRDSP